MVDFINYFDFLVGMHELPIQAIREFNRFYTGIIGLLDQHILNSPFSLPEARVLYELYHSPACTAKTIMAHLPVDKGYLSRILAQFKKKGLVTRKKSEADGRAALLTLTARGKAEFQKLDASSEKQVKAMLKNIPAPHQANLVQHMMAIREILHHSML
jgi:DNA-binding MarR family transcriptional regulator